MTTTDPIPPFVEAYMVDVKAGALSDVILCPDCATPYQQRQPLTIEDLNAIADAEQIGHFACEGCGKMIAPVVLVYQPQGATPEGLYMADFSHADTSAEIFHGFGTTQLPTPYSAPTRLSTVLSALRLKNPAHIVTKAPMYYTITDQPRDWGRHHPEE